MNNAVFEKKQWKIKSRYPFSKNRDKLLKFIKQNKYMLNLSF